MNRDSQAHARITRPVGRPRTFDQTQTIQDAMELFWMVGYDGATTPQLEATTGLARSSLANALGAKRDIFLAALDAYLDLTRATLTDPLRAGTAGLDDVAAFFERLTEAKTSEPGSAGCLVVNTVVAFGRDDPDITKRTQRGWDDLTDALRVALRRAAGKGEIGDADETRVTLLLSVTHGVNLAARSSGPDAARTYADAALALLDSWRSEQQPSRHDPGDER